MARWNKNGSFSLVCAPVFFHRFKPKCDSDKYVVGSVFRSYMYTDLGDRDVSD